MLLPGSALILTRIFKETGFMSVIYDLRRWIAGSACSMAVGFGVWFAIQHTGQASSAEIGILPASAERVNLQGTSDHPMFGGTPNHNMVNPIDTDIPSKFEVGDAIWKSALGSRLWRADHCQRPHFRRNQ